MNNRLWHIFYPHWAGRRRLPTLWRHWLFLAAGALAVSWVSSALASSEVSSSSPPEVRLEQRLGEYIPLTLAFYDESDRQVTLREYFHDRPVVLVLAYLRCPRLCTVVLNGLTECLRRLDYEIGKEFLVLTVSFDPQEPRGLSAAARQAYLESYGRPGGTQGWHFLRGEESAIRQLADAVGFKYYYDQKKKEYVHPAGILVLTPQGQISHYFYGLVFSPRDLGFALEDASAGRIGSPVLRPLRLLCYSYDPQTGKYTLLTLRLVQLGGGLTLLLLGVLLWRFWHAERQRQRSAPSRTASGLPPAERSPTGLVEE